MAAPPTMTRAGTQGAKASPRERGGCPEGETKERKGRTSRWEGRGTDGSPIPFLDISLNFA